MQHSCVLNYLINFATKLQEENEFKNFRPYWYLGSNSMSDPLYYLSFTNDYSIRNFTQSINRLDVSYNRCNGCFQDHKKISSVKLKILFWSAISMIAISVGMDLIFHIHSELIYFGAAVLITAHVINFKKHKH